MKQTSTETFQIIFGKIQILYSNTLFSLPVIRYDSEQFIFCKIYDTMRKEIVFHTKFVKELNKFSKRAQKSVWSYVLTLEETGRIEEPFGKKLNKNLFELRIFAEKSYRIIYAYMEINKIIFLSSFVKKSQKTPKNELNKALKRLSNI